MNTVGYFEIQADNLQKSRAFYSNVFEWKFVKAETIPREYWRRELAGIYGGPLKHPAPEPPPSQISNVSNPKKPELIQ